MFRHPVPAARRERSPHQLPPGRHGLARDLVAEHQRQRLLAAVPVVVAERGYAHTAIDHVVRTAGVSRRTFYEHFETKDAAFLVAYGLYADAVLARVREAVDAAGDGFADRIVAGLERFLADVARDEPIARTALVEVLGAGPDALARRAEALAAFAALLDASAKADRSVAKVPPLVSSTVVGGIYEVVAGRVARGELDGLPDLLPDLAYSALLPYVGGEAAQETYRRLKRRRQRARRA